MTTRPQALEAVAEAARAVVNTWRHAAEFREHEDASNALAAALATLDAMPTTAPREPVDSQRRLDLWDAINGVVTASGGSASCTSVARQRAVAAVEHALAFTNGEALDTTPAAAAPPTDAALLAVYDAAIIARSHKGDPNVTRMSDCTSAARRALYNAGYAAGYARRGREVVERLLELENKHWGEATRATSHFVSEGHRAVALAFQDAAAAMEEGR